METQHFSFSKRLSTLNLWDIWENEISSYCWPLNVSNEKKNFIIFIFTKNSLHPFPYVAHLTRCCKSIWENWFYLLHCMSFPFPFPSLYIQLFRSTLCSALYTNANAGIKEHIQLKLIMKHLIWIKLTLGQCQWSMCKKRKIWPFFLACSGKRFILNLFSYHSGKRSKGWRALK